MSGSAKMYQIIGTILWRGTRPVSYTHLDVYKRQIQYYADCLKEDGCTSPQDMDKLKLSLQGYNYGNGYITWAIRKYGGYSAENALQFSNEQAASHGWSAYGDPEYVPHVLRYYSSGGLFAGLFGGNGQIAVSYTHLDVYKRQHER